MSIHRSLRSASNLAGERSVFTRVERLAVLKKAGKFDDTKDSVHGLPKVRTQFKVAGAKKAKAAKEGDAAAKPAAGGTVAAPAAAGAKGGAAKPGAAAAAPAKADAKKKK